MKFLVALLVLPALAFAKPSTKRGSDWGYVDPTGPDTWAKNHPICGGKLQSPINIESDKIRVDATLKSLDLSSYYDTPDKMVLTNNGAEAEVKIEGDSWLINGGPLDGEYMVEQFHFHWGATDCEGSEHTIDGLRHPMEIHIVHYSTKFEDYATATHEEGGLAVLSLFFNVQEEDNPKMEGFVKNLGETSKAGDSVDFDEPCPLSAFLPDHEGDLASWSTYEGSLTTPGCDETVTWIIFHQPMGISEKQLNVFRSTLEFTDGTQMINNFRPIQETNDRPIRRPKRKHDE